MQKGCLLVFTVLLSVAMVKVQAQTCGVSNTITESTIINASGAETWAPANNVRDGNNTTKWALPSGSPWIYADLGTSYTACKVVLNWDGWNYHNNFTIEVSSDTLTWTQIASNTAAPQNVSNINQHEIVILSNNLSRRYLRVSFSSVAANAAAIADIEVYVKTGAANDNPVVTLTAPDNNITVVAGSNLSITADASDADGTVSKVEFYNGTTKLGEDLTAPYEYIYTSIPAGTYQLTAKAIDNLNATTTTSAHTISVISEPTPVAKWVVTGNSGIDPLTNFLGTTDNQPLYVRTNNIERLRVTSDGKVGVGMGGGNNVIPSEAMFAVNGNIWARKLKVTQDTWADYVFAKNYKLMPLKDLEAFIKKHKHLPGVPTTKEVTTNGISVGENQELLLKKVEELTLYVIQLEKEVQQLKKQIKNER